MKKLTLNEQIFLIAIWLLDEEAYGAKIRKKIKELTGTNMLFGTIYNTLEYLVRKEYVTAQKRVFKGEVSDNKRVFYSITDDGLAALSKARELQKKLWKSIPEYALDKREL